MDFFSSSVLRNIPYNEVHQLHWFVFCPCDSWHAIVVIIIEFQNEDKQEKDKAITSKKREINEGP